MATHTHNFMEIKNCPFCGDIARWEGYGGGRGIDTHFVFCNNEISCTAMIGPFSDEEEAIQAWNNRHREVEIIK
jgi:hypothetical protein